MRSRTRQPGRNREPLDFSLLQRAFSFTKPYRLQLTVGMIATVLASVLALALPLLARELFNEAFTQADAGTARFSLNLILGLMLGLFALEAVFGFLRSYLLGLTGEGVVADLRTALFSHLLSLSPAFFQSRRTGELTSRLTSDVTTVQGAVSQTLAHFTSQAVSLIGGIVVLLFINAQLTLFLLGVVPLVLVVALVFGRFLRRISTRFQDSVAAANANAEEALGGIRVVKSFVAERFEAERYSSLIAQSFALARRRALGRALFIPGVGLLVFSGIAFVLWYGSRQVLAGALQPGDLVAFLILTITIGAAVGTLSGLYSELQQAVGASRRIFELLDERTDLPEPEQPVELGRIEGEVRFDGVDFAYADGEPVLHDIDLLTRPGEVVALVGPSGAGKTSLVMLVPRFFDPLAGRVTLDGHDLRSLSSAELRANVGVVFQETVLFSGTIRDNIRYGSFDATDEEIVAAARAANALEFIERLDDGLDALVGERGLTLSGGQRQRIAIARAVLRDPRILILDEATSALDSESEALVQAALDRLMKGRTTFVIAHRLSTVHNADRIVVLDQGRIVQQGTHDELISSAGLYSDLYERQFSRPGSAPVLS